jgi:hypothetical protein
MRAFVLAGLVAGCCHVGAGNLSDAELESARVDSAERAGAGYSARVVRPFVVVADSPDRLNEAEQVVAFVREALLRDFFQHEPGKAITIWVWGDKDSYMSGVSAVFDTIPSTPYGFYRPCKRALFVNAGFGWGTLIHEMVHAYIDADFPDAPTWLNEGMGSLFESTFTQDGHLVATVNWRLPHLQQEIRAHHAPSFDELVGAGRLTFDGKHGALYYAMARYVLYWEQEHGELREFYRAYRDYGLPPLPRRAEWEAWVLALHS